MRVHDHQKLPSDKARQIRKVVDCVEAQTKLSGFGSITLLGGCSNIPDGLEIWLCERRVIPSVEGEPCEVSKPLVKVTTS